MVRQTLQNAGNIRTEEFFVVDVGLFLSNNTMMLYTGYIAVFCIHDVMSTAHYYDDVKDYTMKMMLKIRRPYM